MNLILEPGTRCLLLGANGAGKTTLLKILGGKHMVGRLACPACPATAAPRWQARARQAAHARVGGPEAAPLCPRRWASSRCRSWAGPPSTTPPSPPLGTCRTSAAPGSATWRLPATACRLRCAAPLPPPPPPRTPHPQPPSTHCRAPQWPSRGAGCWMHPRRPCIPAACAPCGIRAALNPNPHLRAGVQGDFPAQKMIDAVPGVDAARKDRLIKVLDIDPTWRMHQVRGMGMGPGAGSGQLAVPVAGRSSGRSACEQLPGLWQLPLDGLCAWRGTVPGTAWGNTRDGPGQPWTALAPWLHRCTAPSLPPPAGVGRAAAARADLRRPAAALQGAAAGRDHRGPGRAGWVPATGGGCCGCCGCRAGRSCCADTCRCRVEATAALACCPPPPTHTHTA
jgi:hypothetical protein